MTRREILDTLSGTPRRVEVLARGLSPLQLGRRPKEGQWSLSEILKHLLLGERDVIFPRLQRMLLEEAPTFPSSAASHTGFAATPASREFREDLAAFHQVRSRTVTLLEGLGASDWLRVGTTPTRGTLTMEAYARYLAEHDLEHLVQFEATREVVVGIRAVEDRE